MRKLFSTLKFIQRTTKSMSSWHQYSTKSCRAKWAEEWFARLSASVQRVVAINQTPDCRVRIAILDTGVNKEHPDIARHIKDKTIIGWKGFPDSLDPLGDKNGHGTHGASVLIRTAPHATLLIVRVADDNKKIPATNGYISVANARIPFFLARS